MGRSAVWGWVALLVLASFVWLGVYSRPLADDYCQIADGARLNPVNAVINSYTTWSGRYSAYFIVTSVGALGTWVLAVMPLAMLAVFAACAWDSLRTLLRYLGVPQDGVLSVGGALLATVCVWAMISPQALYWIAGSSAHGMAVLAVMLMLALFLRLTLHENRQSMNIALIVGLVVLAIVAAGFSEIFVAFQMVIVLVWLMLVRWAVTSQRATLRAALVITLVALALGGLVVMLSPGNAVRQAAVGAVDAPRPALPTTIFGSLAITALTFAETYGLAVTLFAWVMVTVGLLSVANREQLLALPAPKSLMKAFFITGALAFCLVFVNVLPPTYAIGYPSLRTLTLARLTQILLIFVWGYLTAIFVARRPDFWRIRPASLKRFRMVIIVFGVVFPLVILVRNVGLASDWSRAAAAWDARDAQIRAAVADGADEITVSVSKNELEDYFQLEKVTPRSAPNWVNGCLAAYYGIEVFAEETAAS